MERNEKDKLRRDIKEWITKFSAEKGREPSQAEKKAGIGKKTFKRYHQVGEEISALKEELSAVLSLLDGSDMGSDMGSDVGSDMGDGGA